MHTVNILREFLSNIILFFVTMENLKSLFILTEEESLEILQNNEIIHNNEILNYAIIRNYEIIRN